MEIIKKPSKDFLFLIGGVTLVLIGIAGFYFFFLYEPPDQTKTNYFSTLTSEAINSSVTLTPREIIFPEFTPDSISTASIFKLNFQKYYIHAENSLEQPNIPDRIVIPSINLDAPVIFADFNFAELEDGTFGQWEAPNQYAAGWHPDSALLGAVGNTVINGHHNEYGEVFGRLVDLKVGDEIFVYSNDKKFSFVVANTMILQELFQNTETRLNNARWLGKSDDERLTLVTCWPKLSNTHRLIIVARPVDE